MEFDGELVNFNVFNAVKYPTNLSCAYWVDIAFCNALNADSLGILEEDHVANQYLQEVVFKLESFK